MGSTARLTRRAAVATIALAMTGLGVPVTQAADKTMRFGHMWPASSGWGKAAQRFADLVKERSGGKLHEVEGVAGGKQVMVLCTEDGRVIWRGEELPARVTVGQ